MSLLNGTALVTGAGSGIGHATALAYAQAGCRNIALADVNEAGLEKTSKLVKLQFPNVRTLEIVVDVSDEGAVVDMVNKTVEAFGGLDYAANVAGVTCRERYQACDYSLSEYDEIQSVNSRGLLLCVKFQVKAMLGQPHTVTSEMCDMRRAQRGSIVNIASVCGLSAISNIMPYVASKHAVVGITRAFAIDHGKDGIRINAVCPGIVETPMLLQRQAMINASSENGGATQSLVPPLGRLALPEEIADICVFLSSSMSSHMHGSMVTADGGKMASY